MAHTVSLIQRSTRDLLGHARNVSVATLVRSGMPAVVRLGSAFVQLLSTILIARFLGAEGAGIYFFWAVAFMEAGQVATLGLDRLALQRVPRLRDDPSAIATFLAPLRSTAILLALLLAGGLCAYSLWVQSDVPRPAWWYLLPPLGVAGVALSMINGEAMAGMGRPVLAVCCRHTAAALGLVTVIVLLNEDLTPNLAMAAYAGAFFASGFGVLAARGPGFRQAGPPLKWPSRGEFRDHVAQGSPIFLSTLFTSLAFLVPLTILERIHPSEEIAFLTTAFRIFVLVDVLAKAIHSTTMPELSRAAADWDLDRLRSIYRSALIRGLALLTLPIVAILFLSPFVMSVFGERFELGASVLVILMIFGLISLALGPAHQLLLMVGHTRGMAAFSLVHLLVVSVLAAAVVPSFGPEGLAVVLGSGILLEKILYLGSACRITKRKQILLRDGNNG